MLPHNPPLPVAAHFNRPAAILTVTWDRRLLYQPTALGNWQLTVKTNAFADNWNQAAPGSSDGFTTTIPMVFRLLGAGVSRCTYFAVPPDVVSWRAAVPAAAFTDFPMTADL